MLLIAIYIIGVFLSLKSLVKKSEILSLEEYAKENNMTLDQTKGMVYLIALGALILNLLILFTVSIVIKSPWVIVWSALYLVIQLKGFVSALKDIGKGFLGKSHPLENLHGLAYKSYVLYELVKQIV